MYDKATARKMLQELISIDVINILSMIILNTRTL